MGSLCLSSAPILRCESLERLEAIILVIPTVFEVVFSTSLIFIRRGTGDRQYLWLMAEGWVYLILALLDMTSHLLPAGRESAGTFKAIDTVLAVTSFLPILFYTLFILLFSHTELITILPARIQVVSKMMLPIFILLIGTFNQLSSLVGISHDIVTPGSPPILVGFKDKRDETLWTFFTSLTLALLTAYQASSFILAFHRLGQAFLDKRRIQTTEADEAHPFRGIGWICGGFKLGAIETLVGFAQGTFGTALTRRILRFLARAFVCIGIAKGLDSLEDFKEVRRELVLSKANRHQYRRSRIREFISNPRLSTFRQFSPTATAFHTPPRAPRVLTRSSPLAQTVEDIPNMTQVTNTDSVPSSQFGASRRLYQRVTMNFKDGTPVLDVRLSQLDMPSIIGHTSRSRHQSEFIKGPRVMLYQHPNPSWNPVKSSHTPSLLSFLDISSDAGSEGSEGHSAGSPLSNPSAQEPEHQARSLSSSQDPRVSPLTAVRELTAQFPVVPPRAFIPPNQITVRQSNRDFSNRGSRVVSEKTDNESATSHLSHTIAMPSKTISMPSKLPTGRSTPTDVNILSKFLRPDPVLTGNTSTPPMRHLDLDNGLVKVETTLRTRKSGGVRRSSKGRANLAEWINYNAIPPAGGTLVGGVEDREESPQVSSERRSEDARRKDDPSKVTVGTRRSRIKSIGSAPRRSTPTPTMAKFTRDSLHLEPIVILPAQPSSTMVVEEGSSLESIYGRGVLRDSEVLAIEAGSRAQTVGRLY